MNFEFITIVTPPSPRHTQTDTHELTLTHKHLNKVDTDFTIVDREIEGNKGRSDFNFSSFLYKEGLHKIVLYRFFLMVCFFLSGMSVRIMSGILLSPVTILFFFFHLEYLRLGAIV